MLQMVNFAYHIFRYSGGWWSKLYGVICRCWWGQIPKNL